MIRFHVNVAVADLEQSVQFYRTLFGADPVVQKDDYAKWMLEDPRINFSVSGSAHTRGINHVGLQAESMDELGEIRQRLRKAGKSTFEQPDAECCYARSSKTWVRDPDAVAWEAFVTHNEISHYGDDLVPAQGDAGGAATRCCG